MYGFNMLFQRYHSKRKSSIKQHTECLNFLCKIQLSHPGEGGEVFREGDHVTVF